MNTWARRLCMWLMITLASSVHGMATKSLPNTPEAMLLYHGSALLFDWLLLIVTPAVLSGRLCDQLEMTCLLSMVGNFVGWIFYMAYVGPVYCNAFIKALTAIQWLLLIIPDRHADHSWIALVRHRHRLGGSHHS